jgi:UrcA family protein
MKTFVAAVMAAAALCAALPASAASRSESFDLAIASDGYDLTDPGQVAKLRKQIDLAIIEACNPTERLSVGPQPNLQCRKEMRRDAAVKIAALTKDASKRMAGL